MPVFKTGAFNQAPPPLLDSSKTPAAYRGRYYFDGRQNYVFQRIRSKEDVFKSLEYALCLKL